jgi:hypothetical protein
MKKRKLLLLSLLLFAGGLASAQKWDRAPESLIWLGKTYNKGQLLYANGQTKDGYIAIPKTCNQGEISIKTDRDGKATDVKSEYLQMITIYNRDSSEYIFERVKYMQNPGDMPKREGWLFVMEKGYATLYLRIDKYKIDKEGMLNFIAEEGLPLNFVRKKNEHAAVLVASTNPYPGAGVVIGINKAFKKNAPVVFAEDKELVAKIKAEKYTSQDIVEVVKIYNAFMEGK